MNKRALTYVIVISAVTLLGAACTKKTTVTTNTTINTTTTANTNTSTVTNARTTGDFSTSTNTASQVATVTLSSTGITPKLLTVTPGTVVTFTNTDTAEHQIASDPHPNHTNLPGFDNTARATSYSFTFTRTGTFGYHDHLNPSNTDFQGTVVVQ